MGLAVGVAVIGIVMLTWPKPFVGIANYYRGGTGLSLGARTSGPPLGKTAFFIVRALGASLMIGSIPLALMAG